jgi:membrane associated rhomboid family serine protease
LRRVLARGAFIALFLASGLIAGFTAGVLSPGGARAGAASGLLSAVFGLGAIALYFIAQASASPATGDGVPEGLWPIAIMILGFFVLPAAVLAGALGGGLRTPSGPSQTSPGSEL